MTEDACKMTMWPEYCPKCGHHFRLETFDFIHLDIDEPIVYTCCKCGFRIQRVSEETIQSGETTESLQARLDAVEHAVRVLLQQANGNCEAIN